MITVLGATGYIGSNILNKLIETSSHVYAPKRGESLEKKNLGHIIYCIGMTSDFRTKPFETVDAHVCVLNKILSDCEFESLTYLSSTRVYINLNKKLAEEEDKILIDPLSADELYTLTKLTGERLCFSSGTKVKVVRLSNVFGNDFDSENFLSEIIKNIYNKNSFTLHLSLSSSKDYLHIEDAVNLVIEIALKGNGKIYNIASGKNTSNEEIITELKTHTQFTYDVDDNCKEIIFPLISIKKIKAEFNFQPKNISEHISILLKKV